MKFRNLKKKKFILYSGDYVEGYEVHYDVEIIHDKGLSATAEWEYDNGLYTETGRYPFIATWKYIKYNLKNDTMFKPLRIKIYNGKCKCGRKITFKQFIEDSMCDKCLEKWESRIIDECKLELESEE